MIRCYKRRDYQARSRQATTEAGQSLVEFSMILPVLLLLAWAVADVGHMISVNTTLIFVTREGARQMETTGIDSATNPDPDLAIVSAMTQTLESSGLSLANLKSIDLYYDPASLDSASDNPYVHEVWQFVNGHPSGLSSPPSASACAPPTLANGQPNPAYIPGDNPSISGFTTVPSSYQYYCRQPGDDIAVRVTYNYVGISPLYQNGLSLSDATSSKIDPTGMNPLGGGSGPMPTPAPTPTPEP